MRWWSGNNLIKMKLLLVFILQAILFYCYGDSVNLTVSVYYETLCDDSIRFITTQAFPTYKLFGGYHNQFLDLDFVPYGKAQTSLGKDGKYNFTCHHGNAECEGNKMQACALKYLPKQHIKEFIYCSMKSANPPESGPQCAKQLYLDFTPIQNCMLTDGPALLAYLGNRTYNLKPSLTFVPWIVFNSVFNEADHSKSQTDFLSVVCKKLQQDHDHESHSEHCKNASGTSSSFRLQQVINFQVFLSIFVLFQGIQKTFN